MASLSSCTYKGYNLLPLVAPTEEFSLRLKLKLNLDSPFFLYLPDPSFVN